MIYKVVERNVFGKGENGAQTRVKKFYAKEVAAGRSTFNMIADKIEARCSVTRPDILAVLAALTDDVVDRLQSGQIVEMGELGNMQLTLQNKRGAATKEEWTTDLIKGARITYRPSSVMKKIAREARFNRWDKPEPIE